MSPRQTVKTVVKRHYLLVTYGRTEYQNFMNEFLNKFDLCCDPL